jgi:hypothetical protein
MTDREAEAARELAAIRAKRSGEGVSILAVDPGTASTGVALIVSGEVAFCDVIRVKGSNSKDRLPEMCRRLGDLVRQNRNVANVVAIEWQAIRPDDKRPNDVLNMAMVVGAALANVASTQKVLLPLPVQWKGSISGDLFSARVAERFPGAVKMLEEAGVPSGQQHNGLDAAALGLWAINERLPWRD